MIGSMKALAKRMLGPERVNRWRMRGQVDKPAKDVFVNHFRQNFWGNNESVSGPGSSTEETLQVRTALRPLLDELGVRSMLDAPCGDFHWMQYVNLDGIDYVGGDIVQPLIEANTKRYARPGRRFVELDISCDPLPQVDLIFCRDCLFHLSFDLVQKALANFAGSGARFLLTTTHPATFENIDIVTGGFRPLNLEAWPFRLPPPIKLIHERLDAGFGDVDKALGLWHLPLTGGAHGSANFARRP